jgi:uncharacterized protein YndB with AHSA1/START domain
VVINSGKSRHLLQKRDPNHIKKENEMTNNQAIMIEPVQKQVMVPLQTEDAFRLFTEGFGKWWPLATHSVGEELAETCFFEGQVGGHIYEVMKDGSRSEWGKVLDWAPSEQVIFQWYPSRTPESAQKVTVRFSEVPGGTLVELVQTGWESLGAEAQARRGEYDFGWEFVLANYIIAAARK